MGEETFIQLYKTLVRPSLEYASTVWSPSLIKDKQALENVQRRATKLVKRIQNLSYPERLVQLGLPSLEYRRLRADMLQTYRIFTGKDNLAPEKLFCTTQDQRTRGHRYKIYKQRCSTKLRSNFFSSRVVDSWNSLTDEVVEAVNINTFKNRLNSHWKNHPLKFRPSFM